MNKAFHGLAAGVRFSATEGYAWDFSSKDKKEPVIPSERTSVSHLAGWLCEADDHWVCLVELQLKLKQKYEKMEKQRETSARVDSILIQLMKRHAPEIAERLERKDTPATAAAAAAAAVAGAAPVTGAKRDSEAAATATNDAKRPRVG